VKTHFYLRITGYNIGVWKDVDALVDPRSTLIDLIQQEFPLEIEPKLYALKLSPKDSSTDIAYEANSIIGAYMGPCED
jgi:hypothetical protein